MPTKPRTLRIKRVWPANYDHVIAAESGLRKQSLRTQYAMDSIYHEQQVGQLCAQHCLNNLLQGPLFDPIQLADIASKLDDAEKAHLTSEKVLQKPSNNMDDSGFFSIQVISEALKVFGLGLTPRSAPRMKEAMDNPVGQKAFICNHDDHWLTIRKLGSQWFNLDSLKKSPELVTDLYLNLFLAQLQVEGYSIFVVTGPLPVCEADELLSLITLTTPSSSKVATHPCNESDDITLAMAISASLSDQSPQQELTSDELRKRRLLHLEKQPNH